MLVQTVVQGQFSAVSSLEQGVDINSVLCGVSSVTVHFYTLASPALDTLYTAAITVNYKIYTASKLIPFPLLGSH